MYRRFSPYERKIPNRHEAVGDLCQIEKFIRMSRSLCTLRRGEIAYMYAFASSHVIVKVPNIWKSLNSCHP